MHNLDTTTDGRPDGTRHDDHSGRDDSGRGDLGREDLGREDSGRRELMALHAERAALERRLTRAEQERLYLADPGAASAAGAEEAALLAELDRVMTRIRAAEYRSQPGARTW